MELRQLDSKSRITLPAKIRKDLNVDLETVFKIEIKGGAIVLQPITVVERKETQS